MRNNDNLFYSQEEVDNFIKALLDAGKLHPCDELPYYMTPVRIKLYGVSLTNPDIDKRKREHHKQGVDCAIFTEEVVDGKCTPTYGGVWMGNVYYPILETIDKTKLDERIGECFKVFSKTNESIDEFSTRIKTYHIKEAVNWLPESFIVSWYLNF